MNIKDVKFLWGRSGNRCAFPKCRIELATYGESNVIGEIAHIIAKNPKGPRGNDSLSLEKRDEYANLILLCPTHHTLIDNDPNQWTAKKLFNIKNEHEQWVIRQLEKGTFSIPEIDNSKFLNSRKEDWKKLSKSFVWITLSFTPLNIQDNVIDSLRPSIINLINSIALPDSFRITPNDTINKYDTRPNEYGIINENLRKLNEGFGYRIQIFRNGHTEFLICLEISTKAITDYYYKKNPNEPSNIRILRYTHVAECFQSLMKFLKKIWEEELPFRDMLLTAMILNTEKTKLYSYEIVSGYGADGVFGYLVTSKYLEYNSVVEKDESANFILESLLNRFINSFGLVIDSIFDEKGFFNRPDLLNTR